MLKSWENSAHSMAFTHYLSCEYLLTPYYAPSAMASNSLILLIKKTKAQGRSGPSLG